VSHDRWKSADREEAYRQLDHPADIFFEARGGNLAELFEHALLALYDQIAELDGFDGIGEATIAVEAASREDALRELLAQALFKFESEGFVATEGDVLVREASDEMGHDDCRTEQSSPGSVSVLARLWGETADRTRHSLLAEVKAVTYHRLSVTCLQDQGWRSTVILDV